MIAFSLLAVICLAAATLAADSISVPRIVVRNGRFIEKESGKPFTPLGVNYYRVGKVKSGKAVHAGFCPGFYDRAFVGKMMADVAAKGFNTVRTFQMYNVGEDGILVSPQAREVSPEYLANVVHFLRQARKNNLHVIFSWDIWNPESEWWSSKPLPHEVRYAFRPEWDPAMGANNYRFCLGAVRTRANAIVSLIEALKREDPTLLPVVMSWELENEVYFIADQAPFNVRQGTFRYGSKNYDVSSDAETQSLMDDVITQWADACAGAIHHADPDALVSAGLFSFAAVGRGGPGTLSADKTGDPRVPARPMALLRSSMDYIDIHLYAWRTDKLSIADNLKLNLDSDEWDKLKGAADKAGRPVMVGETGVFAYYLRKSPEGPIDHKLGLQCLEEQLQMLKDRGFAGALYWHYGNLDSTPNDDCPVLALFPQYAETMRKAWSGNTGK